MLLPLLRYELFLSLSTKLDFKCTTVLLYIHSKKPPRLIITQTLHLLQMGERCTAFCLVGFICTRQ